MSADGRETEKTQLVKAVGNVPALTILVLILGFELWAGHQQRQREHDADVSHNAQVRDLFAQQLEQQRISTDSMKALTAHWGAVEMTARRNSEILNRIAVALERGITAQQTDSANAATSTVENKRTRAAVPGLSGTRSNPPTRDRPHGRVVARVYALQSQNPASSTEAGRLADGNRQSPSGRRSDSALDALRARATR